MSEEINDCSLDGSIEQAVSAFVGLLATTIGPTRLIITMHVTIVGSLCFNDKAVALLNAGRIFYTIFGATYLSLSVSSSSGTIEFS